MPLWVAVLRALQVWATRIEGSAVVIRADSSVARAMAGDLSMATKSLNYIASEMVLWLEKIDVPKLVLHPLPGQLNIDVGWLTQIGDRGEQPACLAGVRLIRTAALSERELALTPPGFPNSPWVQSLLHPTRVYECL